MKKIKIIFAVMAVIAMLCSVAFAESVVTFDNNSVSIENNSVTITIKSTSAFEAYAGGTFSIKYDPEVWEFDSSATQTTDSGAQVAQQTTDTVGFSFNPNANVAVAKDATIVSLKFNIKSTSSVLEAKNTKFNIVTVFLMDTSYNQLTTEGEVIVKGSDPKPEVTGTSTTAQGTTFGNYKDVPLFKYEATVSNTTESTKFYMTPELFLNGTSAGTKAKTLIPGLTVDGEGKIVVNIAIVGAPEGTVTINPNITAE